MKKNKQHYCVILAGGGGSQLWPVDRESYPKQFHDILKKGQTLIQETFDRISSFFFIENIFVVTLIKYKKLTLEQLPDLHEKNLLLEPLAMNTSASIVYSSFKIWTLNKNAIVFTTPSDQIIEQGKKFNESLSLAFKEVQIHLGALIILGIKPTYAETNYGYIQFLSEELKDKIKNKGFKDPKIELKKVKTFVEKPSFELANDFLKSGDFLWNSGMFIWQVESILKEFKQYLNETYEAFYEGISKLNTQKEKKFIKEIFPTLKKASIDYMILEKSKKVYVVVSHFEIIDVSHWSMIYKKIQKDDKKNALLGDQVFTYESNQNMIYSNTKKKVIIVQGLRDFIIIDTRDALLICKQRDEKQIKQYLKDLKINGQEEFL